MRKSIVRGLAAAVALMPLASCSGHEAAVVRSGDSFVLIAPKGADDNIAGVALGGEVQLVGNCLGLGPNTILWPHGTEVVDDDPLTVQVPGYGRVALGDHIAGGGEDYGTLPTGIDKLPTGCSAEQLSLFVP